MSDNISIPKISSKEDGILLLIEELVGNAPCAAIVQLSENIALCPWHDDQTVVHLQEIKLAIGLIKMGVERLVTMPTGAADIDYVGLLSGEARTIDPMMLLLTLDQLAHDIAMDLQETLADDERTIEVLADDAPCVRPRKARWRHND